MYRIESRFYTFTFQRSIFSKDNADYLQEKTRKNILSFDNQTK